MSDSANADSSVADRERVLGHQHPGRPPGSHAGRQRPAEQHRARRRRPVVAPAAQGPRGQAVAPAADRDPVRDRLGPGRARGRAGRAGERRPRQPGDDPGRVEREQGAVHPVLADAEVGADRPAVGDRAEPAVVGLGEADAAAPPERLGQRHDGRLVPGLGGQRAVREPAAGRPDRALGGDGEDQLDLVRLRMIGQQVGRQQVGQPGGDARVHQHRALRLARHPAQPRDRAGAHRRDVDQHPAPRQHMTLGHQPLVGHGADDQVDAVDRPLEGVRLVEVNRPEVGAGIGPPPGPDTGPARRAERRRDRRAEHPLTAEHEHPAGARPADVRHRPPSRLTLSYTARL